MGRLALCLLASWVAGLAAASTSAQEFVARVDRTEMAVNETLTLDVIYAERADTDSIDFDAMLPDFSILGIRPSSQTRIVNFKRSSQTSWQLTLLPRKTGRLRIPAFQIGSASTRPIDIEVREPLAGPSEGAALSARLDVDRERAFIGEQVLVRIALSASRDVSDLRGAALDVPGAETLLVDQREYQRVVGGAPYQVTELAYAVFPQTPGRLEIPGLQYTGRNRRGRIVVARTEPRTIEILDPAADAEASRKRPWLPADAIALASEWSGATDALVVGEPVTRTIRVAAASQHAAAIPPIVLPDGPYKQYAEQPSLEDTETATGLLGRRTDRIVLVPTAPGTIEIPEIEIDWWNIDERAWKTARLPAETLRVVAPAARSDSAVRESEPIAEPGDAAPRAADRMETESVRADGRILLFLAGACAILLVACIALWLRVRRLEARLAAHEDAVGASDPDDDAKAAFQRVLRALSRHHAADVRRSLLDWARLEWPGERITRLEELAARSDRERLQVLLAALDASLYRTDTRDDAVDYDELRTLLEELRSQTLDRRPTTASSLTPLYPTST